MPVCKLEKPGFIYVAYRRDRPADFDDLRKIIGAFLAGGSGPPDIVVDLTACVTITEGEVGLLALVVKRLEPGSRCLRLVAKGAVAGKLRALNLPNAGKVVVYDDHAAFLKDINGSTAGVAPPAAVSSGA